MPWATLRMNGCLCLGRRRWRPANTQAGRPLPTPAVPRDQGPQQVCGGPSAWESAWLSAWTPLAHSQLPEGAGAAVPTLQIGSRGSERWCHLFGVTQLVKEGSESAIPLTYLPAWAPGSLRGRCPHGRPYTDQEPLCVHPHPSDRSGTRSGSRWGLEGPVPH